MYIIPIPESGDEGVADDETIQVQVQLPKEGLVVDERVIPFQDRYWEDMTDVCFEFECKIEGTTLTVTVAESINSFLEERLYWYDDTIYFRVYDPEMEEVPDFTDESYIYHGLEHEKPPRGVKILIVHPSVTIIQEYAFKFCQEIERCIMGDNVKRIEESAFYECHSLRSIRLSRGLQYIEEYAFSDSGIECLFIPPSVEDIHYDAFRNCYDLKILVLPPSIDRQRVGHNIVKNDHLPLIRLCADPDITAPMIRDFIQTNGTAAFFHTDADYGLTPLHILTRYNGFASKDVIVACYDANPSALITPDGEGNTPLTNLWWGKEDANDDELDLIVQLVQDLCNRRKQSQEANFKSTNVGKRKRDDDV